MFKVSVLRLGTQMKFFESAIHVVSPDALDEIVEPPGEGRYFILVAVLDYVRLATSEESNQVLVPLADSHKKHIREERSILILDLSNEGPPFEPSIFDALHSQLEGAEIPRDKVWLICQNRRMAQDYHHLYGSGGLAFWALDYFPHLIVQLFDRHRGNINLGSYSPLSGGEDRAFNCLNAAPRWHRVLLFRWLQDRGFLKDGLVSFHGTSASNPKGGEIDINRPPSAVAAAFPDLLRDLHAKLPSAPIRFDAWPGYANDLASNILLEAYGRTHISIVTESDFFYAATRRVTEKAVKTAAVGHPFIIVGAPRSIEFMRQLGFRTFDAMIDHGYDLIEDDIARMMACLETIKRSLSSIDRDADLWRAKGREDALYNLEHGRHGMLKHFEALTVGPLLEDMRRFIKASG